MCFVFYSGEKANRSSNEVQIMWQVMARKFIKFFLFITSERASGSVSASQESLRLSLHFHPSFHSLQVPATANGHPTTTSPVNDTVLT